MASTFPPPATGWEFIPDFDGTVVIGVPGGVALAAPVVRDSNDYDPSGAPAFGTGSTALTFAHVYPQLRNITAFSLTIGTNTGNIFFESSIDSVDGVGGTWILQKSYTDLNNLGYINTYTNAAARKPTALPLTGIKSLRIRSSSSFLNLNTFNVWGTYTVTNALHIWHPTLDQPLIAAEADHGDMIRGALSDKQFRVKNTATGTANSVQVALVVPQYAGALTGSTLIYNSTSAGSHNIGTLTPGAISGVITCRRTMAPNAVYGDKGTVRVTAVAGSWT